MYKMKPFKEKLNIAIFGASGHIAKNLIYQFSNKTKNNLFLFSRNKIKLKNFISSLNLSKNIIYSSYDDLHLHSFDIIINCIGISDPIEIKKYENNLLILSEKYDDLIIEYLQKHNSCQYLNFSSGVVYGNFLQPPNDESLPNQSFNDISNNVYSLAKIHSEIKHRSTPSLNIIDIRIFSFFSRFIDLNTSFFISKIITSINNDEEFITTRQNFTRDFIHPDDLFQLIYLCMNSKSNFVLDAYSTSPISKYDMLEEFSNHYNLKYSFNDNLKIEQPTGFKENYYSLSRKAKNIGYIPIHSSLETILNESRFLIKS